MERKEQILPFLEFALPDNSLVGLTMLIVEDNEVTQILHQRFAEIWGMRVEIAENGRVAVQNLTIKNYDIILMDMQMPVLDGIAACREIRQLCARGLNIPIIGVSASALPNVEQLGRDAGMNAFLRKPFTPEQLFEQIKLLVSN